MNNVVNIFWTGGFDSTFRIIQLSQLEVTIQPYYIWFLSRESRATEFATVNAIMERLKNNPKTKCNFLPIIKVDRPNIPNTEPYDKARRRIAFDKVIKGKFGDLGGQYGPLAAFVMWKGIKGMEMAIHQDDRAMKIIKEYWGIKLIKNEGLGDYAVLSEAKENSLPEVCMLFSHYRFPLVNFTKLKMKEIYVNEGYEEEMNMTWFCHKPIDGKPCGTCGPCCFSINEGMTFRFDEAALERHRQKFKKTKKTQDTVFENKSGELNSELFLNLNRIGALAKYVHIIRRNRGK